MLYLFFTILGFALGSTLFAYWTPKIIRHIDIRELPADHNPGVANAFMYGGFFCGLLSLILELAKGFVPVFLGQRFLDTHSLLFIPVLIAPVFGHAFPFFRKEKGGKAITASFGVLLGLFPEMRPAVYLAFFFIFFSLIVVVSPHSFRSVVTFGLFALCVLFTVKVPSIQIGSFLIAAVVIYRHFIKYLGEPLHIRLDQLSRPLDRMGDKGAIRAAGGAERNAHIEAVTLLIVYGRENIPFPRSNLRA